MRAILTEKIKDTICKWDKGDIYAISLLVEDSYDNPCEPTVTLGYNTLSHFQNEIVRASSEREAKCRSEFNGISL